MSCHGYLNLKHKLAVVQIPHASSRFLRRSQSRGRHSEAEMIAALKQEEAGLEVQRPE